MNSKMPKDNIFVSEETETGIALILVDENTSQNEIIIVPGACNTITAEEVASVESIIKECEYVLLQLEVNQDANEMIDAILKLMPLDVEYCDTPLEYMVPDADSGVDLKQCDTWDEAIAAAKRNGYENCAGPIERTKFYDKAGKAVLTVCTSETRPYGCFILQKGVM